MTWHEIVIAGSGAAGTATALALVAEGLPAREIAIVDPAGEAEAAKTRPDARILALNAGSRRLLGRLGIWDRLSANAHPMAGFTISDTALDEDIRPPLFDLGGAEPGDPIAHLVPLGRLVAALRDKAREAGIKGVRARIAGFAAGQERIAIDTDAGPLAARLLVGADGADSTIRRLAGIPFHGWAYGQTAIAATLRHALPHGGMAVQHFLPSGPFAMLPLDEGRSSIVWSEREAIAQMILAADRATQLRELARRAAGWRGEILDIEALSSHPLSLRLARRFVGKRLALVADAAHVVHPLAGQGLNLGLADVAELAEQVGNHLRLGLDPGAPEVLEAYQARRRPAAAAMACATEGINRLFSNESAAMRILRDLGAGLLDRLPGAKSMLRDAASGTGIRAPRLLSRAPGNPSD
jgi:2-octaprenyl-6-methoxyphenol hydroxylase